MNWKKAPVTVWMFIALMVVAVLAAALPGEPSWPIALVLAALTLLSAYLLLRGSRSGWWALVGMFVVALLIAPGMAVWPWEAAAIAIILLVVASLACLLAPQTRRWIGVDRRNRLPADERDAASA